MKSNSKKQSGKKNGITLVIPEKPTSSTATPAAPTTAQPETPKEQPAKKQPSPKAILAAQIANDLGETARFPRSQVRHILWALGTTQTQALVEKAKEVHAGEGLMIPSGKRKRTLGGVFFFLAYSEGKPKEGRKLTRPDWKPRTPKQPVETPAETPNEQ